MKTLTIEKIEEKEIQSRDFNKWVIKFVEDERYFDSFIGKWNRNWKVGDKINIEDDQWQKPKEEKYNWLIKAPESAKQSGGNFGHLSSRLDELNKKLDIINKNIICVLEAVETGRSNTDQDVGEKPPTEAPVSSEEVSEEDSEPETGQDIPVIN